MYCICTCVYLEHVRVLCVYVCVCICTVYVCTYVCMCFCMYEWLYICICVCICERGCVYLINSVNTGREFHTRRDPQLLVFLSYSLSNFPMHLIFTLSLFVPRVSNSTAEETSSSCPS